MAQNGGIQRSPLPVRNRGPPLPPPRMVQAHSQPSSSVRPPQPRHNNVGSNRGPSLPAPRMVRAPPPPPPVVTLPQPHENNRGPLPPPPPTCTNSALSGHHPPPLPPSRLTPAIHTSQNCGPPRLSQPAQSNAPPLPPTGPPIRQSGPMSNGDVVANDNWSNFDLESRFTFHGLNELPVPDEWTGCKSVNTKPTAAGNRPLPPPPPPE